MVRKFGFGLSSPEVHSNPGHDMPRHDVVTMRTEAAYCQLDCAHDHKIYPTRETPVCSKLITFRKDAGAREP
jgi:hypothetical protein